MRCFFGENAVVDRVGTTLERYVLWYRLENLGRAPPYVPARTIDGSRSANHTIWMLTVMEPSRTISLLAHVFRFATLTCAAGMLLPPALLSQTAQELIGDACYNELQQREEKTLWSYRAERRIGNRVMSRVPVPSNSLCSVNKSDLD